MGLGATMTFSQVKDALGVRPKDRDWSIAQDRDMKERYHIKVQVVRDVLDVGFQEIIHVNDPSIGFMHFFKLEVDEGIASLGGTLKLLPDGRQELHHCYLALNSRQ